MVEYSESSPKGHKDYKKWWTGKNQNCVEIIIIRIDTVLKSTNFRISPRVERNIIETTPKIFLGKLMTSKFLYLNFSYCLKANKSHIQLFKTKRNV